MNSQEIAGWVEGVHHGEPCDLDGVATLESAGARELAFSMEDAETGAGCVLVREAVEGRCCIVVADPKLAFIQVLGRVFPEKHPTGIHPTAVIDGQLGQGVSVGARAVVAEGAVLEEGVVLYPGVYIGRDCHVGAGSVLFPHVVLYEGTVVGKMCRIHAGSVLGSDGFSAHPGPEGPVKVPQVGRVVLEDGVEIGANCCVDRAFLEETRIGTGSHLDNLVHIGHNSQLGANCLLAAQVGISGSVKLGDGVVAGGQAGVADHCNVGPGANLAARAGVISDLEGHQSYLGFPALPANQGRRALILWKDLPDIWKELQSLRRKVEEG